jgi:SHS family lactate transporter-like MFS transporter
VSDTGGADRLTGPQIHVILAAYLGWTLDAFDFFIMAFVLREVAATFGAEISSVAFAITLTLACRAIGAFAFGRLADRYGRRPTLIINVLCYSLLEFCSGLAPTLAVFLVLRALYGVAMGGEWGIGASLAMESIPARARGIVSGLLQEGYAAGYLLGALAYGLLFEMIHWRGLLALGILPAVLVLFIRHRVPESPVWEASVRERPGPAQSLLHGMRGHWPRFFYLLLLMTAFNMFSHGSQDVYPTFLKRQMHFDTKLVSLLTVVLNLGAIAGGLFFGAWSERIGRKKAIVVAALLALPMIPLWSHGGTPLALGVGVFLLQMCVQGAWGVVPAHLNELSPDDLRGTMPGFAYQGGNLLASTIAVVLAAIAARRGGDYGFAMSSVIAAVAVALAIITAAGPEAKGRSFLGGVQGSAR